MAGVAAAQLRLDAPGGQVDVVVQCDHALGRQLEEVRRLAHRAAGVVHVGARLHRQHLLARQPTLGRLGLKAPAPRGEAVAADDRLQGHEADVVPIAGVTRPRVAEADQQQHGDPRGARRRSTEEREAEAQATPPSAPRLPARLRRSRPPPRLPPRRPRPPPPRPRLRLPAPRRSRP